MSNPGPATTVTANVLGTGSSVDGKTMGDSTTSKISFYGVTPIVQRSLAAQATSLVGTASSTDVNTDFKAAVIEIMNTLTAIGIWKGGA